jgi:hypothetical protein
MLLFKRIERIPFFKLSSFFFAFSVNRVELSHKHIECFGIRALSEPYEIVAHHMALQFNLYSDLPLLLDFGSFSSDRLLSGLSTIKQLVFSL